MRAFFDRGDRNQCKKFVQCPSTGVIPSDSVCMKSSHLLLIRTSVLTNKYKLIYVRYRQNFLGIGTRMIKSHTC